MIYIIDSLSTPTAILSGLIVLFVLFLTIYHALLKKNNRKTLIWRVLCFVPLIACIVHSIVFNFGKQEIISLSYFATMYIVAILIAVWQIFCNKKILYRISVCVIIICSLVSYVYIPAGAMLPSNLHCYTYSSWTDSFISTVRAMEREYPLSDWKGIDYDALIEEFVPRVQEAEKSSDTTALGIVLNDYCNRFYDGHISLVPANSEIATNVNNILLGNDYGLSLITTDIGDVVAVQIEPDSEAELSGIHTGTKVTKWNGVPINEAKLSFDLPIKPPVAENEEPTRTMLLAGKGGDTAQVTFITDSGEEKTVTLNRIGDYMTRYTEAYSKFCNISADNENFSYKMISDTCGYLQINSESLKTFQVIYAVFTGHAPFIETQTNKILEELKSQGMTELIIDIRNNTGGHPEVSAAVASLFSKEDSVYSYDYSKDNSNAAKLHIKGNGKWADLPTVVLVNQNTISSGDGLADMLSSLPNVTLMGLTPSNCSYQSIGGTSYLAQGYFAITYPVYYCTDPDGTPKIDTDTSRVSRIPLEVEIPLDLNAVETIYASKQQDYELNFAMKWLKD